MIATATLRTLDFEVLASICTGACFIDVRDVDSYLDVHIPGSIEVLYEAGPGFNSRARDCIPLNVPLILGGEIQSSSQPNSGILGFQTNRAV